MSSRDLMSQSVSAIPAAPVPSAPSRGAPMVGVRARGVRVLAPGQSAGAQDGPAPMPAVDVGPKVSNATVTPVSNVAPHAIQFCAKPFTQADLALPDPTAGGDGGFDRTLSRDLKAHKRVVVDLVRPYPDRDAAPAALAPWLSQAKAGGGAVTVKQYCKASRGMLGSWLAKLVDQITGAGVYRPARGYDVVLYADALDRKVTQIAFTPRGAGSVGAVASAGR